MLTRSDKKWLQENFATKDDLENSATKNDLKPINQKIDKLASGLESIKKDTTKIRRDLEMVTGEVDKEQVLLKKRVDRVEEHLGLPSIQ